MENIEINEKDEMMTPVEQIMLDTKMEKYKLISVAARWIEELSRKEEFKYLTFNQLLEYALKDILTGKVSVEDIKKLPPIERKKQRIQSMSAPSSAVKGPREYEKKNEPSKKEKRK